MARYRVIDQEQWLPSWARGKNLPVKAIKLRLKDGSSEVIQIPEEYQHGGGFEFEVDDPRTIHLLDVDTRVQRVS